MISSDVCGLAYAFGNSRLFGAEYLAGEIGEDVRDDEGEFVDDETEEADDEKNGVLYSTAASWLRRESDDGDDFGASWGDACNWRGAVGDEEDEEDVCGRAPAGRIMRFAVPLRSVG